MKKFEPGKIYFTKLMTDNCLDPASLKVKVLSRTEKTVKVLFEEKGAQVLFGKLKGMR